MTWFRARTLSVRPKLHMPMKVWCMFIFSDSHEWLKWIVSNLGRYPTRSRPLEKSLKDTKGWMKHVYWRYIRHGWVLIIIVLTTFRLPALTMTLSQSSRWNPNIAPPHRNSPAQGRYVHGPTCLGHAWPSLRKLWWKVEGIVEETVFGNISIFFLEYFFFWFSIFAIF